MLLLKKIPLIKLYKLYFCITDPEAVAKRQFGQMTNFNPGLGSLAVAIDRMLEEMDYNRRVNENKGRFAEAGRR